MADSRNVKVAVWGWVTVVVGVVVAIALFGLDRGLAGMAIGVAITVCLAMLAVMVWVDRREAHRADRTDRDGEKEA